MGYLGTKPSNSPLTSELIPNSIITNDKIAAMAASKLTGQVADANAPSGSVIQVVQTVKTDTYTMASTTFTNVTGMSATITPTNSSNKILILSSLSFSGDAGAAAFQMKFTRNGTTIFVGDASGSRTQVTWESITPDDNVSQTGSYAYLDSPASASAVTYQLQIRSSDGPTIYINRSAGDGDSAARTRGASSIILMEIAG